MNRRYPWLMPMVVVVVLGMPILGLAICVQMLVMIGEAEAAAPKHKEAATDAKASSTRWAPYIVVLDKPATAYAPDGSPIPLPAGAEVDACSPGAGHPLLYAPGSRTVHVPEPCTEPRPIFRDGFEP